MVNSFKILILFISAAFVLACNSNTSSGTDDKDTARTSTFEESINNPSTLSEADAKFVTDALTAGMMEIEAGNVAINNGSTKEIKDFGQMMVSDHTGANDELHSIAATKNATIPLKLSESAQQHVNDMKNMKGKEFDDHYKQMMADDHQKAVAMFEDASKNCSDADLKAWATKTLPGLKSHLEAAKALK